METERHFSSLPNFLSLFPFSQIFTRITFNYFLNYLLSLFTLFSPISPSFHSFFRSISLSSLSLYPPPYFLPHPFLTFLIFIEARLSQTDIFNEACALRLAAYYGTNRGRGRRQLDHLMKRTDFSKNELKLLYWGWKCTCPSGLLTESNFKEMYAQFFPQAGQYDDTVIFMHYDISLILPLH